MAPSVLLVDDERFARTLYSDYLRAVGHEVEVADSSESALVLLAYRPFDVLVTDVILPGAKDGLELLDAAKQLDPNIGVVVITALDEVAPDRMARTAEATSSSEVMTTTPMFGSSCLAASSSSSPSFDPGRMTSVTSASKRR